MTLAPLTSLGLVRRNQSTRCDQPTSLCEAKDLLSSTLNNTVILSEVTDSRSESVTQSKDPYSPEPAAPGQGILPCSRPCAPTSKPPPTPATLPPSPANNPPTTTPPAS